jgi:hypothetical protein
MKRMENTRVIEQFRLSDKANALARNIMPDLISAAHEAALNGRDLTLYSRYHTMHSSIVFLATSLKGFGTIDKAEFTDTVCRQMRRAELKHFPKEQ